MASIKVKYRPSTITGKEGVIYYQVIHKRTARQISTGYPVYNEEWHKICAIEAAVGGDRAGAISSVKDRIGRDIRRLKAIVARLEARGSDFTADEIVEKYREAEKEMPFFQFMESVIGQMKQLGKTSTAENYTAARNSFLHFCGDKSIRPDEIDADLAKGYEAYLKLHGISMNTVSFYIRILRAVYNRAVEKGMTSQHYPFKHVYTGIDKTRKRAVSLKTIRRIKDLDLSAKPSLDFARDLFLFSFYTRGMSFVDMAYLKKKDLHHGTLTYRRRKTGKLLVIRWEQCMQDIIDKYPDCQAGFLLPIIRKPGNEHLQYRNALRLANNKLKEIAALAGAEADLTMYVSRHSWASIAQSKNIPLAVISQGMGHDSEATTQIYLASLDHDRIDKANWMIIKEL